MPLHAGGESDSFIDVAIKDDDISTIVSASRLQDRVKSNKTRQHDVDVTAWRAKEKEGENDNSSIRSKETISTGCSLSGFQPVSSRRASIQSECNDERSIDTFYTSHSTKSLISDFNSIRSLRTNEISVRKNLRYIRRDSVNSAITMNSERDASGPFNSAINSVKTIDTITSRHDDNLHSDRDSQGTNDGQRRTIKTNIEEEIRLASLQEKLAQLNLQKAEVQSHLDQHRLKNRNLNLEFGDQQKFLRKLQEENIALRQENEGLYNDSQSSKKSWYEASTSLLSPSSLSAFSLSSTKKSIGYHEELESTIPSTIAPQTMSTGSSSYFGVSATKLFGYMYKEEQPKEIESKDITPKNITVTTKIAKPSIPEEKQKYGITSQRHGEILEHLAQQLKKQKEKDARKKLKKRMKRKKKKFGLSQVTMGGQISTLNMDELDLSDGEGKS
mmetsp:Transcript_30566/g.46301  ORF Transcript_30566/g.46301 Transcript_30566/m.46301 type:complete len:444 (+) Transcript_30566:116-1447(+)